MSVQDGSKSTAVYFLNVLDRKRQITPVGDIPHVITARDDELGATHRGQQSEQFNDPCMLGVIGQADLVEAVDKEDHCFLLALIENVQMAGKIITTTCSQLTSKRVDAPGHHVSIDNDRADIRITKSLAKEMRRDNRLAMTSRCYDD